MHKKSYASGFLFHIPSQQILLQQIKNQNDTSFNWSLFGGIMLPNESFRTAFQRIIHDTLKIKISPDSIFDIYDYYSTDLKKNHAIVYAEVTEFKEFSSKEESLFTWVKTKTIDKLPISAQMKHDITVGKRVINARERSFLEAEAIQTNQLVNET